MAAGQKYVIGVDGGTESLRAGVFDAAGRPLAFASSPYPTSYPHPSWAEQSPDDWWAALGAAVRAAVEESGVAVGDIAAMCVDTTCCTVVALDESGAPLRPALLWMDMRSAKQAAAVADCGAPELRVNAGGAGPVSAEWMVPKALWLKQNEPKVYGAAHWICEYQDYLNFHLTGEMVASIDNVAIRWHASGGVWPERLLAALGMEELRGKWPQRVLPLGERIGSGLTERAAAHLGLPVGLPVAQGGADAFIGVIGLGVIAPGQMAMLTGSSHLHIGIAPAPMSGPGMFGSYADAVLPGGHVVEGGQTSTGSVINWLRRALLGEGVGYGELNEEAAAVPPGCEGLVALDHFQGNRTPHTDPLSRGALVGLTLKHTRGHVFRALMEAVCFGTEAVLAAMRAAGFSPSSLTVAGGATKSDLWLQIHADVTNLPLHLTEVSDAPALGCAILAAVAAGLHPDVPAATAAMVRVARTVKPDPARHAEYARLFRERYVPLYPALKGLFHGDAPTAGGGAGGAAGGGAAAPAPAPASAAPAAGAGRRLAAAAGGPVGVGGIPAPPGAPPRPIISPSILAADFAALGDEVARVLAGGADWVHVDMFDGSALAGGNFTIGPPVVAALRRRFPKAFLDCHLAVEHPEKYIAPLADAGASSVTIQIEPFLQITDRAPGGDAAARLDAALGFARRALGAIRERGLRAAIALAPATPLEAVMPLVEAGDVDMVLCMTVECGFGGQRFQEGVLAKVAALRAAAPSLQIQVDGGINADTARAAAAAGANAVVAGTAVFGAPGGVEAALAGLREALVEALPGGLARAAAARRGGAGAAATGAQAAAVS
ncbi:carbohydrate kinase [Raphidocelis subcapitata]|uniref:Carbohydrate kinase n=1 Tax=Raphidocelis subcapitata TaxID=307507 RepID=A0A2V0NZK0_9CHLO|nr:carbohydrate kinase [Raphidocelis subcapitata]|eukprot:GBF92749.1 carbohydrate kinase [Raphidocelis subcapitata]